MNYIVRSCLYLSFYLFLIGIYNCTYAQFSLGVEAGLNYSTIKYTFPDDNYFQPTGRRDVFIGISPAYKINNTVSCRIPVHFSNEGCKNPLRLNSVVLNNQFLRILPQFEYRLADLLGIYLGVNMGILLNDRMRSRTSEILWEDTTVSVNKIDLGAVIGSRWHFSKVYLLLSYNFGIVPIDSYTVTGSNGEFIGEIIGKSQNIQLGAGYSF